MTTALKVLAIPARVLSFALAGVCLAAAVVAQGGRFDSALDLLTHFAPLWGLGALLAGALGIPASQGRVRLGLAALAGLGVLASLALVAPELTRPIRPAVAPGNRPRLRLIQFNAWDLNADPDAAAAWIDSQRPDIVTVEETTPRLTRALVARGFHLSRGMLTSAIFSRGLKVRRTFRIPKRDWPLLPDFARATFASPDGRGTFTVAQVHLNWPTLADHRAQPFDFAKLVDNQPRDRLVVAGDFNLTPWSFTLRALDRRLGLERRDRALFTWPAGRAVKGRFVNLPALLPIDHVYAGSAWRTVDVRRGPRLASDHYPIIVDLALVP